MLGNGEEMNTDIDLQEAQQTLNLSRAEGKRQVIEANIALRQARTE